MSVIDNDVEAGHKNRDVTVTDVIVDTDTDNNDDNSRAPVLRLAVRCWRRFARRRRDNSVWRRRIELTTITQIALKLRAIKRMTTNVKNKKTMILIKQRARAQNRAKMLRGGLATWIVYTNVKKHTRSLSQAASSFYTLCLTRSALNAWYNSHLLHLHVASLTSLAVSHSDRQTRSLYFRLWTALMTQNQLAKMKAKASEDNKVYNTKKRLFKIWRTNIPVRRRERTAAAKKAAIKWRALTQNRTKIRHGLSLISKFVYRRFLRSCLLHWSSWHRYLLSVSHLTSLALALHRRLCLSRTLHHLHLFTLRRSRIRSLIDKSSLHIRTQSTVLITAIKHWHALMNMKRDEDRIELYAKSAYRKMHLKSKLKRMHVYAQRKVKSRLAHASSSSFRRVHALRTSLSRWRTLSHMIIHRRHLSVIAQHLSRLSRLRRCLRALSRICVRARARIVHRRAIVSAMKARAVRTWRACAREACAQYECALRAKRFAYMRALKQCMFEWKLHVRRERETCFTLLSRAAPLYLSYTRTLFQYWHAHTASLRRARLIDDTAFRFYRVQSVRRAMTWLRVYARRKAFLKEVNARTREKREKKVQTEVFDAWCLYVKEKNVTRESEAQVLQKAKIKLQSRARRRLFRSWLSLSRLYLRLHAVSLTVSAHCRVRRLSASLTHWRSHIRALRRTRALNHSGHAHYCSVVERASFSIWRRVFRRRLHLLRRHAAALSLWSLQTCRRVFRAWVLYHHHRRARALSIRDAFRARSSMLAALGVSVWMSAADDMRRRRTEAAKQRQRIIMSAVIERVQRIIKKWKQKMMQSRERRRLQFDALQQITFNGSKNLDPVAEMFKRNQNQNQNSNNDSNNNDNNNTVVGRIRVKPHTTSSPISLRKKSNQSSSPSSSSSSSSSFTSSLLGNQIPSSSLLSFNSRRPPPRLLSDHDDDKDDETETIPIAGKQKSASLLTSADLSYPNLSSNVPPLSTSSQPFSSLFPSSSSSSASSSSSSSSPFFSSASASIPLLSELSLLEQRLVEFEVMKERARERRSNIEQLRSTVSSMNEQLQRHQQSQSQSRSQPQLHSLSVLHNQHALLSSRLKSLIAEEQVHEASKQTYNEEIKQLQRRLQQLKAETERAQT